MAKSIHSVGVHEAKTQLSELLRRVEAGETIEIRRNQRPLALLVPAPRPVREFGVDAGVFSVPDDFDEPLPDDELASFEG